MARFNEQIEPIYALLRETDDVNLSHDLLEPEPAEIPALKQRSASDKPHTLLKHLFPSVSIAPVLKSHILEQFHRQQMGVHLC